nr:hypothetical protein [Cellulomonas carbonis]
MDDDDDADRPAVVGDHHRTPGRPAQVERPDDRVGRDVHEATSRELDHRDGGQPVGVDPVRAAEPGRRVDEALPQPRHPVQPPGDERRGGGGVGARAEREQRADVHRHGPDVGRDLHQVAG